MDFKKKISSAIAKELNKKEGEINSLIEIPPESSLGDYALPCFRLGVNPKLIAESIASKVKLDFIDKIETKGPYVNFFVDKKLFVENVLAEVLKSKKNYGKSKIGKEKVMVEYSQANTHKAFHVGHIRATSLGESISRVLEFSGNKVVRANYQGDTGMHVAKWIWCYQKYHSNEKLKDDEGWIASIYVEAVKKLAENEYLQKEVDVINQKLDSRKDKKLNELWKKTRKLSLDSLEKVYQDLNTKFDKYFFESQFEKRAKEISKELVKKKIAEISDEATIIRLDEYNLGVWVLLRKDGTVLYSGKDIALAEEKFNKYKIDKSIYVVGKAQEMHFMQLFKTLELMKFKQASKCRYVPVSEVRLPEGKMSSRTGDNILYSDFKKEIIDIVKKEITQRGKLSGKALEDRALAIAIASMKYTMLSQGINKGITFDKKEAIKFEGDTGPYLQYSYARACSILKKVKGKKSFEIPLLHDNEIKLIKRISIFPDVVENVARDLDPSGIAHYAHELAQSFNEFYNSCKVVGSEEESFRLKLVEAFKITLGNALFLLGIAALEKM